MAITANIVVPYYYVCRQRNECVDNKHCSAWN